MATVRTRDDGDGADEEEMCKTTAHNIHSLSLLQTLAYWTPLAAAGKYHSLSPHTHFFGDVQVLSFLATK